MSKSNPTPGESTLYVCQECGKGVENPDQDDACPDCGGPLRNTTVAHD
ncbi:rubrerythrin-like domain-containing protein [Haloglomus salinum]|nr:rubrerythrin-like domain-containing protein [Haloglomus salinum]